jgi:hypothetical protein
LFDDVFQFFHLAGSSNKECQFDPFNLAKFNWKELEDLMPLDVTTTTDMAAD